MDPVNLAVNHSSFVKKPIRIVPDANVLFTDPFFQSIAAKAIEAAGRYMDIKLTVGDITLDEVRNIFNEQLEAMVNDIKRVVGRAEAIKLETGVNKYVLGFNSKKSFEAWEERWNKIKKESASLPYPIIDARELAQRSIQEYRPFLKGDKGYRDYLLWISILNALQADDCNYILVSNDNGFYAENSTQLHPDLEKELASLKLSGRVAARKSLADVVDEFIKPQLKPDEVVAVAIESGKVNDFTDKYDQVDILIYEYLIAIEIPEEWVRKYDYYDASFDVAEDVTFTDLVSTLELDDKVLVTSEWEASVVIVVSSYGNQEESETVFVSFTVESLVNPQTLEVESHEVKDYELNGWWNSTRKERIPY